MTNSIVCDVKISASLEIASRNLCRKASSEPNNCPKIFCDQLVTRWLATGHRTAQFWEFWKMLVLEPPLKLNFNAKKHFTTFLWPECDHQVTWKSSKYPTSMNFFSKVPGFAGLFPWRGSQTRSKFSENGARWHCNPLRFFCRHFKVGQFCPLVNQYRVWISPLKRSNFGGLPHPLIFKNSQYPSAWVPSLS